MEIAEVVDRGSLKTYLDGLPDDVGAQTAKYVARRAAARVAPVALLFFAKNTPVGKDKVTALPIFGAITMTQVARLVPTAASTFAAAAFAAAFAAA
ncbi:MAG: hypothetical protein ACI9TA_002807, partial [Reinekea sp.]